MGKWIEEYGETLLAGMAVALIIALILTSGILSLIGARVKIKENSYTEYKDFSAFTEVCQREKPTIICNTEKQWYAGMIIPIEEVFTGKDAEGKTLEVKIEAIKDRSGNDYMLKYDKGNHQIIFQQAGVYIFTLKVQDEENLCTTSQIAFSVDNRKEEP